MPATSTAPTASGAEAGCPENRVKAFDVLSWPRVGVPSLESPDRRWENRPRYDGKAVGTVVARYYDPSVGQFLTVDPMVTVRAPSGSTSDLTDPIRSALTNGSTRSMQPYGGVRHENVQRLPGVPGSSEMLVESRQGVFHTMSPVVAWRRIHRSLRTNSSGEPVPLVRNYALQCAYVGHAGIVAGLTLLLFRQGVGLELILLGVFGYAACAINYFVTPWWR
jgi:hypothetical protein